jgi:hypothetical protein
VLAMPREQIVFSGIKAKLPCPVVQFAQGFKARVVERWVAPAGRRLASPTFSAACGASCESCERGLALPTRVPTQTTNREFAPMQVMIARLCADDR